MNVAQVCPQLNPSQVELIERYLDLLAETNAHTNLTAIRDRDEMIVKHVKDSLTALPLLTDHATVLDIGCGAGLPSLILKIANPSLIFTMVDSVRKKTDFVNDCVRKLQLTQAEALHARIEDLTLRDFDFVVARAVAPLNILVEYAMPFLKTGGALIAYKGSSYQEEILQSAHAMSVMRCEIEQTVTIPCEDYAHVLLKIVKKAESPKGYPRRKNLPRTKPL